MAHGKTALSRRNLAYLTREEALEQVAPSRFAFLGSLGIIALLAAGVVWSANVSITSVATAEGEIVPSGDERIVQHLEGGIVGKINVADGAVVTKGTVLLRFDPTLRQAELDQIRAREAALMIRERRLRAFVGGYDADYADLEDDFPNLVEEARVTLMASRERLEGGKAVLEAQIEQRRQSVRNFKKQAQSLGEQAKLVAEVAVMREKLFKKGIESRVNVITATLEQSRAEGAVTEAEVAQAQAQISIEEANNQIRELELNERSSAMEELSEVLAELAEVRKNIERLENRVQRLDVISPVDGVVHRMQVNTPGAVVEPADVLMTIVPVDETIVVETQIAPKDVGHLEVGQKARITVSGFDARRYGVVVGKLESISPTTYTAEDGTTYFKGRILLDRDTILAGETEHRIVPGMTVQADIGIGEQTLLEYLTRPVYVALQNVFSER